MFYNVSFSSKYYFKPKMSEDLVHFRCSMLGGSNYALERFNFVTCRWCVRLMDDVVESDVNKRILTSKKDWSIANVRRCKFLKIKVELNDILNHEELQIVSNVQNHRTASTKISFSLQQRIQVHANELIHERSSATVDARKALHNQRIRNKQTVMAVEHTASNLYSVNFTPKERESAWVRLYSENTDLKRKLNDSEQSLDEVKQQLGSYHLWYQNYTKHFEELILSYSNNEKKLKYLKECLSKMNAKIKHLTPPSMSSSLQDKVMFFDTMVNAWVGNRSTNVRKRKIIKDILCLYDINAIDVWLHEKLKSSFNPLRIAKSFDGRLLSFSSTDVIRDILIDDLVLHPGSRGESTYIPSSTTVRRYAALVEREVCDVLHVDEFYIIRNNKHFESFQFDLVQMIKIVLMLYKLNEKITKQNVQLAVTIDGANLTSINHQHVLFGLKVTDADAIDPITGSYPIYFNIFQIFLLTLYFSKFIFTKEKLCVTFKAVGIVFLFG